MTSRPLGEFIERMDQLVADDREPVAIAELAAASLADALREPVVLEPQHRQPGRDSYRQHVLHVNPRGRYSVLSLVWAPGQATPIHDHQCWCVVGVLQGQERENRYHLLADGDKEWLLLTESSTAPPGTVSVLVPPAENIHRVENAADELTISIHVYGTDIGEVGSSINQVFDLPVLAILPPEAERVEWRDTRARADARAASLNAA